MKGTPTTKLATKILGQDVMPWLLERRLDGKTWYQLADELHVATGGEVSVTHEAVRQWVTAYEKDPGRLRRESETAAASPSAGDLTERAS